MVLFEETQKISKIWRLVSCLLLVVSTLLYLLVHKAFIASVIVCGVFTVLFFMLKLKIRVYEDRFEYRLIPFHVSSKVIKLDSIVGIDVIKPNQIGVFGFKIKKTSAGIYYYFGGSDIMRLRTKNSKDIIFGIGRIIEIQEVLKL